jgi:hypothetical protein
MALIRRALVALVVVVLPLTVYVLRTNDVAGMMVDDGWYILLARTLARGEGYWLINSPFGHILPLYPPGFPALLSLVFRVQAEFPANVWLLKSLSIAAMLGVSSLSYVYLHRDRQLPPAVAACAASAIALTPAFVFLATSTLMTECVFTLAQLSAVFLAQRAATASSPGLALRMGAGAGLVAASAMLIRSAGIVAVFAAGLFLLKERRWKPALGFAGVAVACVLPWTIYARAHAPTPAEQDAHRGSIVYGYTDQLWMRWAGAPMSGTILAGDLPARIATNTFDVAGRSIGGIFLPAVFRGGQESGEEVVALGGVVAFTSASMGSAAGTAIISLLISGVLVTGFIATARQRITVAEVLTPLALTVILLWPFWTFRFVLPLTPFLMFYFLRGLQVVVRLATARSAGVFEPFRTMRIVMLSILGLHLYDHGAYLIATRDADRLPSATWIGAAHEVDRTLDWVGEHVPRDALVASTNPALVYLRTGLRTVTLDHVTDNWPLWRQRGVQYLVCLLPLDLPSTPGGEDHRVVYHSPGRLWVIKIDSAHSPN